MRRVMLGLATIVLLASAVGIGIFLGLERDEAGREEQAAIAECPSEPQLVGEARRPPPETFAKIFQPCAHCHQIGDGARASSGPVLNGIVGRPAATTDYPFSKAMRQSGLTWDEPTLRRFLIEPSEVVPGTRMIFKGLDREQLEPLIEFLNNPTPDA